jgi:hypothetical protein
MNNSFPFPTYFSFVIGVDFIFIFCVQILSQLKWVDFLFPFNSSMSFNQFVMYPKWQSSIGKFNQIWL